MKKFILTIFIILFLVSIYKDLTIGTEMSANYTKQKEATISVPNIPFEAIKIKIRPGDTMLTVVEQLNPDMDSLHMERILNDFLTLNPNVDPNTLQINRFYYFPKYK